MKSNLRGLRGASEVASLCQEAPESWTVLCLIALVFYESIIENILRAVKAQRRETDASRQHGDAIGENSNSFQNWKEIDR